MRFAITLLLIFLPLCFPAAYGAEPACDIEEYFAPDDYSQSHPLAKPHPELQNTMQLARRGDATAQSNLAASYHGGYMVTPCMAKAEYWYRLAAAKGDKNAQAWVARNPTREERESFASFSKSPDSARPTPGGSGGYTPPRSNCIAPYSYEMQGPQGMEKLSSYNLCKMVEAEAQKNINSGCRAPPSHDVQGPSGTSLWFAYQRCLNLERSKRRQP